MKKIMLVCLSLVAFVVATDAQTRGAKSGKMEQAQSKATDATNTPAPAPTSTTGGRPAKESKESQEAADQKDRDDDHEQGEQGGDKIKNLLGLNDDQNAKFRAIVVEVRKAVKAIKKDQGADKMAKIKAIYDDRDAKLKNIFSADQFTKWLDLSKNKGGGMGKHGGMGKGNRKSDN